MPAMLLVHGRAALRSYYWFPTLAKRLQARGLVVLSIDLFGHGQSDGQFANLTYTKAIQDVLAAAKFLQLCRGVNPGSVGGLGYSLGGTAVLLAQRRGAAFKGLLLIAPVGDTRYHVRASYSPGVVRAWRKEGTHSWYDKRLGKSLVANFSYYQDYRHYDTLREARDIHQPVLIIHGTGDAAIPLIESRRLFKALNEPKRLIVVPGARHSFRPPRQRQRLLHEMLKWTETYLANRTSRSVVAVLRHSDRYLILKRSTLVGYYRGAWGIIAGHLPAGADPRQHVYHEILEETGIPRSKLKLIKAARFVRLEHPDIGKTWISKPFLFESRTIKVKLDWEHTAYRWVRLEKFPFKQSYPAIARQLKVLGVR
ncbi:MAG: alpha/beta fold hydrolase [Candidatus Kerfeldbacteria bacterium]|nr:alpha/beta fold hydrolase [Candidatus Kerfeldbacteria bacterium]